MARGHKDKVAVITGAANGLGQAFAERLAEDGVHIAIVDIAAPDATIKMVEQTGRQVLACHCDITSEQSVATMAADVQKKFGRCDIVVNCAGIFPVQAFETMTFADWRHMMSINLDGMFLVTHALVPGMKQRGWGRIVNLSSSTVGSVVSGYAHYVTSKAGIIGFTRALAGELGPRGITVNAIAPSITRTPGTLGRKPRAGIASMEDEFQLVAQQQSIKRVEVPEDVVGTLSYLTSDDAAFVTGQTINVNGGRIFG